MRKYGKLTVLLLAGLLTVCTVPAVEMPQQTQNISAASRPE